MVPDTNSDKQLCVGDDVALEVHQPDKSVPRTEAVKTDASPGEQWGADDAGARIVLDFESVWPRDGGYASAICTTKTVWVLEKVLDPLIRAPPFLKGGDEP